MAMDEGLLLPIAEAAEAKAYEPGHVFSTVEQTGADRFWILDFGYVHVESVPGTEPLHTPGTEFGLLALMDLAKRRTATLAAVDKVIVLEIEYDALEHLRMNVQFWEELRQQAVDLILRLNARLAVAYQERLRAQHPGTVAAVIAAEAADAVDATGDEPTTDAGDPEAADGTSSEPESG